MPPAAIRELRDRLRYRRTLAEALACERNRTLKLLETATIKLSSVARDVVGVSGTAMLKALIEGDLYRRPLCLTGSAHGACRGTAALMSWWCLVQGGFR